jgi:hypothetical protein
VRGLPLTHFTAQDGAPKRTSSTSAVKLPAATEAYDQKLIEEILQHWGNLIDILSTIDTKIEILGWNETLNIKPHMKGSLALTSRDHLQKYVANVFSRLGMNTWLRFARRRQGPIP